MGWVTSTEWQPAPRPVLRPLYAVGDVHGAADLLALLQGKLREINATGRLVYLGDLIDPSKHVRNYDVARTLDLVAAGSRVEGLAYLCRADGESLNPAAPGLPQCLEREIAAIT